MVEFHPENPDAAPVVSGVIQGFIPPEDPAARASSALAVEFGAQGEPSIQIEATYELDTKNLLDGISDRATHPQAPEVPEAEIPEDTATSSESETPVLVPGPFNGNTDPVSGQPDFAPSDADSQLPSAEVLPSADVDDVSEGESLPVYAVDQADTPLVEVSEEDEEEPKPTKRASVMEELLQPETRTGNDGIAVVHPSPFPPARDPYVQDSGTPTSDAGTHSAPEREPKVRVALGSFQPAAFVSTARRDPSPDDPTAETVKPKLAEVPPLIMPPEVKTQTSGAVPAGGPDDPAVQASGALGRTEPAKEPTATTTGVVSGIIGGSLVTSPVLQQQQDAREPLTASGSIIIDPELLAAEQASLERAAAEKAAAEKAAAQEAAEQQAAIEKVAQEAAAQEAAEKAAAQGAAAAQFAASERAAMEQAAAEQAAAEQAAAALFATAEQAAAEKAIAEQAAAEQAAPEKPGVAKRRSKLKLGGGDVASPLGKALAATVRYELSEEPPAPQKTKPRSTRPAAPTPPRLPKPRSKSGAFSDLEIAFFEQDLQKVEEVDTFDDLVADLPAPETPWGLLFGKPKGNPKKKPEPNRRAVADDKPKKTPRPPHKRK